MHFRLPKPLHGWREFAGEVGIIVVGVLIALGAEQVVEATHWRSEVAAERQSLLQEANDNVSAIGSREAQQPCVDRRLAEIRTILERHHRGEAIRTIGPIGRPSSVYSARGTWDIALAGQALSHMSYDDKLAFSDSFTDFALWDRIVGEEKAIWLRLAPLNMSDLLSEQDWSGVRSAYADAVAYNDHIRILAPWMRKQAAEDLPQIGKLHSAQNLAAFQRMTGTICKPILAPGGNAKAD